MFRKAIYYKLETVSTSSTDREGRAVAMVLSAGAVALTPSTLAITFIFCSETAYGGQNNQVNYSCGNNKYGRLL